MVEVETEKKEAGLMETYGLALWTYPLTIIFVILFAICVQWDDSFGKFNFIKIRLYLHILFLK